MAFRQQIIYSEQDVAHHTSLHHLVKNRECIETVELEYYGHEIDDGAPHKNAGVEAEFSLVAQSSNCSVKEQQS